MPRGFVTVQAVAGDLGLAPEELMKAAEAAGVNKFYFRGDTMFKDSDLDRLREIAAQIHGGGFQPQPPAAEIEETVEFAESAEESSTGLSFADLDEQSESGLPFEPITDDSLTTIKPIKPPPPPSQRRQKPGHEPDLSGSGLFDMGDLAAEAARRGTPLRPAAGAPVKPAAVGPGPAPPKPTGPGPGFRVDPTAQDSKEAVIAIRAGGTGVVRPGTVGPRPPPPQPTVAAAPSLPIGKFRPLIDNWEGEWNAIAAGPPAPIFDPNEYLEPLDPAAGGLPMDTRRCFLLDSGVIDQLRGVVAVLDQPDKFPGNPVIKPDTPWEADGLCTLGGSVLYDPDERRLKMWYSAVTKVGRAAGLAVSADGLRWEKPTYDAVQFEGAPTNLVMAHPGVDSFAELAGVVLDPAADPPARYKAVYLYQNPTTAVRGLKTATSPDGIHWTAGSALLTAVTDIGRFLRDPRTGKFVIYGRLMRQGRRSVQRLESEDFVFWSGGEPVLEPDAGDPNTDDVYALGVLPYGRSYVGFVHVFHGPPQCTVDVQLARSRDGWKWERAGERAVLLPLGRPGEWDRYQVSVCETPIAFGERDWLVYYSGRTARHPPYSGPDRGANWGAIGAARFRRDGLAHLQGSFEGGTAITHPMPLTGTRLHLNVSSAFGTVQVHLLDHESRPMDGMVSALITADETDHVVVWQNGKDLSGWIRRAMRLRITLKNARVYGFWTE